MNQENVESRIHQIVADIFGVPVETVTSDSSPDTIETWDSLKHLELVLSMEQELGVTFDPEEIAEMLDVELVVDIVTDKLSS